MTTITTTIEDVILDAVKNNNITTLKAVLDHGQYNKNVIEKGFGEHGTESLLGIAASKGYVDIVRLLFEKFPDMSVSAFTNGFNYCGNSLEILTMFLEDKRFNSCMLFHTNPWGKPCYVYNLGCKTSEYDIGLLKLVLKYVGDTEFDYVKYNIYYAIETNNVEALKILLEQKCVNNMTINMPQYKNKDSDPLNVYQSPLDVALEKGNKEIIDLLRSKNAKTTINRFNLMPEVGEMKTKVEKLEAEVVELKKKAATPVNPSIEVSGEAKNMGGPYGFKLFTPPEQTIKQVYNYPPPTNCNFVNTNLGITEKGCSFSIVGIPDASGTYSVVNSSTNLQDSHKIEIQNLCDVIKGKDALITSMNNEQIRLRQEVDKLNQSINAAVIASQKTRDNALGLQEDISKFTVKYNDACLLNASLQGTCQKWMNKYDKLEDENKSLKSQLESMNVSVQGWIKNYDSVSAGSRNLQAQNEKLKNEKDQLNIQIDKLTIDFHKVKAENTLLKAKGN